MDALRFSLLRIVVRNECILFYKGWIGTLLFILIYEVILGRLYSVAAHAISLFSRKLIRKAGNCFYNFILIGEVSKIAVVSRKIILYAELEMLKVLRTLTPK